MITDNILVSNPVEEELLCLRPIQKKIAEANNLGSFHLLCHRICLSYIGLVLQNLYIYNIYVVFKINGWNVVLRPSNDTNRILFL